MTKPPKAPVPVEGPEPSTLDRMRDLTWRIVAVPKSELPKPEPKPAQRTHGRRGG